MIDVYDQWTWVVFNHHENVEGNCTDLILYIFYATILHI